MVHERFYIFAILRLKSQIMLRNVHHFEMRHFSSVCMKPYALCHITLLQSPSRHNFRPLGAPKPRKYRSQGLNLEGVNSLVLYSQTKGVKQK